MECILLGNVYKVMAMLLFELRNPYHIFKISCISIHFKLDRPGLYYVCESFFFVKVNTVNT